MITAPLSIAAGALSEKEACALFLQLWSAVWHLHLYWICHRDIKPDNLMLDSHLCLKLVDFGFARRVDPHEYVRVRPADGQAQAQRLWFGDAAERDGDEVFAKAISYCGTPAYEARELLLEQPYDPFLADLWSMGVVLYMMVRPVVHLLPLLSPQYSFLCFFYISYITSRRVRRVFV